MTELDFGDVKVTVFGGGDRLVLLHADAVEAGRIFTLTRGVTLAAVSGIDWNRDLSPWSAKGVFKNGGDFSGGADSWLRRLTGEILPAVESTGSYAKRYIAGYSLAGLFALYAVTKVGCFDGAASVSGSLWFDGFRDYFDAAQIHAGCVYFSLGDAEKNSRNPRLAAVEACTGAAYSRAAGLGLAAVFVKNSGGHFNEPEKRCADAVNWLSEQ